MAANRRYLIAWFVVALGVLLGALPQGAHAAAHRESHESAAGLTVRLTFHRVQSLVSDAYLLSNGRYVSFMPESRSFSDVVIDSDTGRRSNVSAPGCPPSSIGSPWPLFACGTGDGPASSMELYVFATKAWRTVTLAPAVQDASDNCILVGPGSCGEIDGVGADWIEFDETTYHGSQDRVFQNIATGEVRDDPTTATTTADLNSPSLAQPLCSPLTTPHGTEYAGDEFYGSLQFYGMFAIANAEDNGEQTAYLEHCGTKLHRLLTDANDTYRSSLPPMSADAHAVIWQSRADSLTGLFLPGMQRFTVKLPAAAVGVPSICSQSGYNFCFDPIALTSRRLYLVGQGSSQGTLWEATSPSLSLARSQRSARRHS
jgi:hypothetical protein